MRLPVRVRAPGYERQFDSTTGAGRYSYRHYEVKRHLVLSRFFKKLRIWYILFCLLLLFLALPYLVYAWVFMAALLLLAVAYSIFRFRKPPAIYLQKYAAIILDCLDFLFIGGLIYLTGGLQSFFHVAYAIPSLACTARFDLKAGFSSLGLAVGMTAINAFIKPEYISFPIVLHLAAGLGTLAFAVWTVSVLATEELKLRDDLFTNSVTDHLTGLFHSGYIQERVGEEIRRCLRQGGSFAIAFLDLDQFKKVNDNCGHMTGNEVLKHVAGVMKEAVRGGETLARYGGDEFLLLLPGAVLAEAELALQRLRAAILSHPYYLENERVRLGVSGGAAEFPKEGSSLEQLLQVADQKMYHQKG